MNTAAMIAQNENGRRGTYGKYQNYLAPLELKNITSQAMGAEVSIRGGSRQVANASWGKKKGGPNKR